MKQLSIAQCSGYPTYLNTSYGREENLADHKDVLEVTFHMCLLFYHYIWQSCSEVVVTLVIYVINQIMTG
jgi:hypothetical protein